MKINTHTDAQSLLLQIQADLESQEAANSLMLGILGQLVRHPERFKTAPCLKAVQDDGNLVVAAIMTPPKNLVMYGGQGDQDRGMRLLVEDLVRAGWTVPGVLGPAKTAQAFSLRWAERTGRESLLHGRQRLYELSRMLLEAGWEYCALFTDLANPTSNSIYQRIGYRPVCDYDEYKFVD